MTTGARLDLSAYPHHLFLAEALPHLRLHRPEHFSHRADTAGLILLRPHQQVSPWRTCTGSPAPSSPLRARGLPYAGCLMMGTNQSNSVPVHSSRINLPGVYYRQSVSFLVCLMLVRHNHPTSDLVFCCLLFFFFKYVHCLFSWRN